MFALAVLVRLLFLRGTVDRDLPYSVFYYGDSRLYREFALALIRGDPFDQGIPYHPPLFAYALAFVIRRVGENPGLMRAWIAVASALSVPLTYLLGRSLWGRAVALTGALFATFSFGLCVAAVSPNTEAVYIPLLLAQALALVGLGRALADGARFRAAFLSLVSGALLGLGSLTRAEHLGLALVLAAALALGWPGVGMKRLAAAWAAAILVACAVIAPWSAHNYRSLTRFNQTHPRLAEPLPVFVPVSSYGALNFALANHAGADGSFKPDLIVAATGGDRLDLENPRHLSIYLHGYRQGLTYLASQPAAAARLVARKLAIGLDSQALGLGLSDWPGGLAGTRRAVDMFAPGSRLAIPVSLLLLVAGAWSSRSLWRRGSVVWLIGLHKLLVCAAFFGYVRLFVQVAPFLYLLQASALVGFVSWLRAPLARKGALAAGVLLGACLLAELALHAASPRRFRFSGSSDPATGMIIQDAPLTLAPIR